MRWSNPRKSDVGFGSAAVLLLARWRVTVAVRFIWCLELVFRFSWLPAWSKRDVVVAVAAAAVG